MSKDFITTTEGMSGFFAVHMWYNREDGGFWEPYDTGYGRYLTRERAQEEAIEWAQELGLEYRA